MQNDKLKKLGLSNICPTACYEGATGLEVSVTVQNDSLSNETIAFLNVKNNFTYNIWLNTASIEPTEEGEIQNPGLFKIKRDDEEVAYEGRISLVKNYYSPESYIKIEPGEVYSLVYSLGLSFEMAEGGNYSIEYIGDLNYSTQEPILADRTVGNERNLIVSFTELSEPTEPLERAALRLVAEPASESDYSNLALGDAMLEPTTLIKETFKPITVPVTFVAEPLEESSLAISRIPNSPRPTNNSLNTFQVSAGGIGWTDTLKTEVINARVETESYANKGAAATPGKYFERWFGHGGHRNECDLVYIDGNCVAIGNKKFKCRVTGREGWKNDKAGCDAACGKWEKRCKVVSTQPERVERVKAVCRTNASISSSRYIIWTREACPRLVLGYMYPSMPNHVWICNDCYFANKPERISMELVATILHEFFHHSGVSEDYAYGEEECLQLAKSHQGRALNNADNYELFCMRA
jgi:hypothetical protein